MADFCTCDEFAMDDSPDSFGFLSTDAPFPLPIALGGTGAQLAEAAALNIIGPLPTVNALDEYDKVLIQQNGTASIRKRRADAFAQDMWDMLYKDAEPIADSTAPITSGAVYQALGGIFSPVKYATPGALVHISDGAYNQPIQGMRIAINPVQNLHGYDNPWPGGGGKNKLPLTLSNLKEINVSGTWTGNKYTQAGVTFEVQLDDAGNVIGIIANGTASANSGITFIKSTERMAVVDGGYIINGCPSGGSGSKYRIVTYAYKSDGTYTALNDYGSGVSVPSSTYVSFYNQITIFSGYTASNLAFYPMVRLASETDATFEPYENLCPVGGWDSAEVTRAGSNLVSPFNGTALNTDKGITVTFDHEIVSISGTSTGTYTTSLNMSLAVPLKLFAGKIYVFSINGNWATPTLRLRLRNDRTDLWYGNSTNCVWTVTPETDLVVTQVAFRVIDSGSVFDVSGAFYCNLNALGAYEPYKGTIYEVSFGSAGTIYGGTLTYNGDGTWTLTVDHYSMTVTGDNITTTVNLGDVIRTNIVYVESGKNATGRNALAISNWLPRIAANYSGNAMGFYFDTETRIYIKVPNNAIGITSETSTEERLALTKTYFDNNPFFVVYPLATPLSFTLTGPEVLTLLAQNSFWADCGEIEELAYRADIGLYLVEALNPIKEMLANREDGMKATRAYSAGDYIVVGNTFYKAATAIANGATLTPGTNVNATTVGAQLKLLS